MKVRLLVPLAAVAVLIAAVVGCSKHDLGVEPRLQFKSFGGGLARPDSTPNPHPGPDTTVVPTVVFASADSTAAGQTGVSRWVLGNNSKKPLTLSWSLTVPEAFWPGFPIQGSLRLAPGKTVPLSVSFPVPASATSGFYLLRMDVTTFGTVTAAFGTVRVFGNEPPPPPPPPPPAVTFLFADTIQAGSSGNTYWQLTNESGHNFTMDWTIPSNYSWPGFPLQGSVALGPNASQQIVVSIPVPDSVTTGPRFVEMQVTRPDSLPPASAPAWISIFH